MTGDFDPIVTPAELGTRCAQCGGPLSPPVERLAVVYGADGELLTACSTACLAGLVAALAGQIREPAGWGN
jgi:hypothetical protein